MKNDLTSELSAKDSSKPSALADTKVPRHAPSAMAFAHYLGLDLPKPKAASAKPQAVTTSALPKPVATSAPSATRNVSTKTTAKAPESHRSTSTAPKAGVPRERAAMPFSSLMNGFKPTARDKRAADTLRVPEVVNGAATGRYLEVERPQEQAPKIDASGIARRIIAAGKRAFGK
ncbi:hypothetical protein [Ralstonia solanacearum]|uniref:hypothetical protein n=1 Tax=Ralstonia solanacearum TaxID=305 RepID=UPI001E43DFFE|nr:hypothetical protein [Ralstonia solanacearum]